MRHDGQYSQTGGGVRTRPAHAMPKARTETWQTAPAPQTPLQRSAFLDLCVDWLVRAPVDAPEDVRFVTRTTWPQEPPLTTALLAPMGLTRAELRMRTTRDCAFCDARAGARPVVANPFAQRCLALVCDACVQSGG